MSTNASWSVEDSLSAAMSGSSKHRGHERGRKGDRGELTDINGKEKKAQYSAESLAVRMESDERGEDVEVCCSDGTLHGGRGVAENGQGCLNRNSILLASIRITSPVESEY